MIWMGGWGWRGTCHITNRKYYTYYAKLIYTLHYFTIVRHILSIKTHRDEDFLLNGNNSDINIKLKTENSRFHERCALAAI